MNDADQGTYSAKLRKSDQAFLDGERLKLARAGYRADKRLKVPGVAEAVSVLLAELRDLRTQVQAYEEMADGCTCGACKRTQAGEEPARLL